MSNLSKPIRGFSLLELLVSIAVASIILISLSTTTSEASKLQERALATQNQQQQLSLTLDRMQRAVTGSTRLILPLHDRPTTDYNEQIREQLISSEPLPPELEGRTAVLAVALNHRIDLDHNGIADADNDGDGRFDEDWPSDRSNDSASGVVNLDDDGDGDVDEQTFNATHDDDELRILSEDPLNLVDDDNDGSIDEDPSADMNGDGQPGIAGVDDDGDGNIDEGDRSDDDEDGSIDEDWIDTQAFYLVGNNLVERTPVPWDVNNDTNQDGNDYIETVLLNNIVRFKVEVLTDAYARHQLLEVTLEQQTQNNTVRGRSRRFRIGSNL